MRIGCHLLPPALHALATNGFLFQFQETPLPSTARTPVRSPRAEAMGDGEAGPGAGGQPRPDQSGCGRMESSPLSLGATSLVSMMVGAVGGGALERPAPHPGLGVALSCVVVSCAFCLSDEWLTLQQRVEASPPGH